MQTVRGLTVGTQVTTLSLLTDVWTQPGAWDIWYADMSITKADGSVVPIATSSPPTPTTCDGCFQGGGWSETPVAYVETESTAGYPAWAIASEVHYYLDDHLGTTQMELSSGGWPLWQGQFTPFGQEIINGGTTNYLGNQPAGGTNMRFKFTGKERDTESGLDYFGARYYASNMGRWMSPDWSVKEEPVPYAKLDDPQSLNLYGYVGNNPLSRADADGHEVDFDKNAKKGEKLLLSNVSKAERKMFQVTKNADGKSVLGLKAGAEDNFKGNHTEGYNRLTTAINSDKVETINVAKTYVNAAGETVDISKKDGGGVTLMYGNGNSTIYVSPSGNPGQLMGTNGQPISDPLGIIMGHETLGHGLENAIGGDRSQHRAIEVENMLRHEQKQPERAQDPAPPQ